MQNDHRVVRMGVLTLLYSNNLELLSVALSRSWVEGLGMLPIEYCVYICIQVYEWVQVYILSSGGAELRRGERPCREGVVWEGRWEYSGPRNQVIRWRLVEELDAYEQPSCNDESWGWEGRANWTG